MANKFNYEAVVQTDTGAIVPGAQYSVTDEKTGTPLTIYSDRAGTTTKTAPYFADAGGKVQFFTDPGVLFRVEAVGGSGTASKRYIEAIQLTESDTDTEEGRALRPGAFGSGGDIPLTVSGDLNNYLTIGQTVLVSAAVANSPSAEVVFVRVLAGDVGGSTPERVTQIAYEYSPSLGVYVRGYTGTWSAWKRIDPQAYGLGGDKPTVADLNDAPDGFAVCSSSASNLPGGLSFTGGVSVYTYLADNFTSNAYQRAVGRQSGNNKLRVFERQRITTTWQDWQEVYSAESLLGAVSQSGGVPTGAVIERGSNANGEYVKFADGTMICSRRMSGLGPIDITWGTAAFISAPISAPAYPASFIASPEVTLVGNSSSGDLCYSGFAGIPGTAAWPTFYLIRGVTSPNTSYAASLTAVGRWF